MDAAQLAREVQRRFDRLMIASHMALPAEGQARWAQRFLFDDSNTPGGLRVMYCGYLAIVAHSRGECCGGLVVVASRMPADC